MIEFLLFGKCPIVSSSFALVTFWRVVYFSPSLLREGSGISEMFKINPLTPALSPEGRGGKRVAISRFRVLFLMLVVIDIGRSKDMDASVRAAAHE